MSQRSPEPYAAARPGGCARRTRSYTADPRRTASAVARSHERKRPLWEKLNGRRTAGCAPQIAGRPDVAGVGIGEPLGAKCQAPQVERRERDEPAGIAGEIV